VLRVMLCMDSHLDPLLVIMIETPHPVHTHSRSSLYIYKVFEHLQQWLVVIRVSLQPDICSHLRVMLCMDSHLDPLLVVLMIETPHPVHSHSRSSLYIYKVFKHLQQWLQVIRVSLQPDICSHGPKSDV